MKKILLLMLLSISLIGEGCPTNTPTPRLIPTPSATPISTIADYTNIYSKNIKCSSGDNELKAKLDYPIDLVVTKDGKKVYVINSREIPKTFDSLVNISIPKQLIYEIKDDKSISIFKINGESPFSCHLSEEIEIDKDDNLYITKPIIDANSYNYIGHEIYKITNDNQIDLYSKVPTNNINSSWIVMSDSRSLSNLHISDKNELIYILRTEDINQIDNLFMLDSNKKSSDIISYGQKYKYGIRDFAMYKNRMNIVHSKFNNKEKKYIGGDLGGILFGGNNHKDEKEELITLDENAPIKSYGKIALDPTGQIYISDPEANIIWKVISDKEIIQFAGSGKNGYKDGKSQEALFDNPTTMVFDGQGNMFLADSGNNAIRKITPDGTVSTFYKETK